MIFLYKPKQTSKGDLSVYSCPFFVCLVGFLIHFIPTLSFTQILKDFACLVTFHLKDKVAYSI